MKLLKRGVVGSNIHRSGWPCVMAALRRVASGNGVLLDDFADASFSYQSLKEPHGEPWVGIFHHPVHVCSPLAGDVKHELRRVESHRHWLSSRKLLKGAIALCDEVAVALREWLKVPVLSIPHSTETNTARWQPDAAIAGRRLVQAGFCLRNTQVIFQIAPSGWQRIQLFGASAWYRSRDEALRAKRVRPDVDRPSVEVLRRLDDAAYDELLATSVVVTELYGAAANNLVVECLARGTPILVNRLPAVEEYLGCDYPLFYADLGEIASLLEPERLIAASGHLLGRASYLPTFDEFARRVVAFVDSVGAA
ncbi:hypothetical protein BH11PLA2_BH11PLA2_22690 [soil metagenome]